MGSRRQKPFLTLALLAMMAASPGAVGAANTTNTTKAAKDNFNALFDLGRLHLSIKQPADALQKFRQCYLLRPDPCLNLWLARAAKDARQYSDALIYALDFKDRCSRAAERKEEVEKLLADVRAAMMPHPEAPAPVIVLPPQVPPVDAGAKDKEPGKPPEQTPAVDPMKPDAGRVEPLPGPRPPAEDKSKVPEEPRVLEPEPRRTTEEVHRQKLTEANGLLDKDPERARNLAVEVLASAETSADAWNIVGRASCKLRDKERFYAAYQRSDVNQRKALAASCPALVAP